LFREVFREMRSTGGDVEVVRAGVGLWLQVEAM
jgi:uncharacterized protein (UPF0335 family)